MADPTTNYAQDLPNVAGDIGSWGTINNALHQFWDTTVKAVSDVADAALPKAGGTMTGEVELKSRRYTVSAKGTVSGAQAFSLSSANYFTATLNGNTTVSFTNIPATGDAAEWVLDLTISGTVSINWPAAVDWGSVGAPTSTSGDRYLHRFYTVDGGTTILAWQDFRSV